jgi:hypothetical protein
MNMPNIRDRFVFLGWIAGLLAAGALVWTLTRPLQSKYLLRNVNRIFLSTEDTRRVTAPADNFHSGSGLMGMWFEMLNSQDMFFVFGVMRDGILVPCGARVSVQGRVEEIIPLSVHARQVFDSIPAGVLRLYTLKIERAFQQGGEK